jgi:hypothetical protein
MVDGFTLNLALSRTNAPTNGAGSLAARVTPLYSDGGRSNICRRMHSIRHGVIVV